MIKEFLETKDKEELAEKGIEVSGGTMSSILYDLQRKGNEKFYIRIAHRNKEMGISMRLPDLMNWHMSKEPNRDWIIQSGEISAPFYFRTEKEEYNYSFYYSNGWIDLFINDGKKVGLHLLFISKVDEEELGW